MEDSEIIRLFFERSEQAICELDKKYGAAATKTAANAVSNIYDIDLKTIPLFVFTAPPLFFLSWQAA